MTHKSTILKSWEKKIEILNLVYKTLKVIAKIIALIILLVTVLSFNLNATFYKLIEILIKK